MGITQTGRAQADDPHVLLALTVIEEALDAIENEGDEEALRWIKEPDTGRLTLKAACRVAGESVTAVQDEARNRLRAYLADDDPIEHDRVDDLDTLRDHSERWIRKDAAASHFDVTASVIGGRIARGGLESVLAPKSDDSDLPCRYVLYGQARELLQ